MSMFESHPERPKTLSELTNRKACELLRDIFKSYALGDKAMYAAYERMVLECGDNRHNYLNLIDVLGGVMSGMLAAVAVHEDMNFNRVVDDIFNDAYADMLDMVIQLEEEGNDVIISTVESTGADSTDRVVGDGEVDGVE